ncbi:MAG: hypothetical protein AABX16_05155 [Nanoarchaeota archaeon]
MIKKNMNPHEEQSFKEKRIREITLMYYSRSDVKKAMLEFSKNRETVPRYFEGFGKRPDMFQYESDISEQAKKGATSFHCSIELWDDPLELSTNVSRQELNQMRIGWDLLLDIDSPYLEYSKIYADLLIRALAIHGIENVGIKFSGSKGFHVIVPWSAFPREIYNQTTKDMFPEWPRIICQYLAEIIKPKLTEKIFESSTIKEMAQKTNKTEEELLVNECLSCHRSAAKKNQITWICTHCRHLGELIKIDNKRPPKCPECRKPLVEKSRQEILFCDYCNINAIKNPELFFKRKGFLNNEFLTGERGKEYKSESLIDADLVLVASRHLFRMPYSLHEKTALVSTVIDKNAIANFQMTQANPFKISVKNYYPIAKENEAKELLLRALDWNEQKEKKDLSIQEKKERTNQFAPQQSKKEFNKIIIPNPTENIFPPQIKLILQGIKQDGRKRALFVLLSFFKSLGVADSEIEKRIFAWNEKNYLPLKNGYIQSQLVWYKRNPARLPPNFANPIYKDLGVDKPDALALKTKNPVSYAIKKYFMLQGRN